MVSEIRCYVGVLFDFVCAAYLQEIEHLKIILCFKIYDKLCTLVILRLLFLRFPMVFCKSLQVNAD
jgi:hypothetical protein